MEGTWDERQVTGEQPIRKTPAKWAIRVTTADGLDMWLTFRTKQDAELNAESMIAPGLDDGDKVQVVRLAHPVVSPRTET